MRITFWTPAETPIDSTTVSAVLGLVSVDIGPEWIIRWTDNEKIMAYDWAMREHLSASDNPVRRRPKPYLIIDTENAVRRGRP
jgi:hypothetical protein